VSHYFLFTVNWAVCTLLGIFFYRTSTLIRAVIGLSVRLSRCVIMLTKRIYDHAIFPPNGIVKDSSFQRGKHVAEIRRVSPQRAARQFSTSNTLILEFV